MLSTDGDIDTALVPEWNPDTDEFVGMRRAQVSISGLEHLPDGTDRAAIRRTIAEANGAYAPEFRAHTIRIVPDDAMTQRGVGVAEYDSTGIKVGRDEVRISTRYFNRAGWEGEIAGTIRHEVGHRTEAVLVDRLERQGMGILEAKAYRDRLRDDAHAAVARLSTEEAAEYGLEYPHFIARRDDLHGTINPGAEAIGESWRYRAEGRALAPGMDEVLDGLYGGPPP